MQILLLPFFHYDGRLHIKFVASCTVCMMTEQTNVSVIVMIHHTTLLFSFKPEIYRLQALKVCWSFVLCQFVSVTYMMGCVYRGEKFFFFPFVGVRRSRNRKIEKRVMNDRSLRFILLFHCHLGYSTGNYRACGTTASRMTNTLLFYLCVSLFYFKLVLSFLFFFQDLFHNCIN